jgi:alanine racemase
MNESSIITLNEQSVKNNIRFLKKKLGEKVKISSVVKSNAYGHGIEQIVPLFYREGIDHFAVFDFQEAVRVSRSLTGQASIMIMGWVSDASLPKAIEKGFEFYVFNPERLRAAARAARKLNIKAKIHLEVETGMNRSGLSLNELHEAVKLIQSNSDYFEISGFCTHLAGAESISNYYRIQNQIKKYQKMMSILEKNDIKPKYRHMANSAAAFVYPKTRLDLVRVGIMQYGFWSSAETFMNYISNKKTKTDPLQRILGWESRIMATKKVKPSEYIGYGIIYLAQTETSVALIPIGYSCGYSRSLSNKGQVLINGHRCNIVGLINMNMLMADISQVPDAKVGDPVVLIGKQGDDEIKVSAFSDISNKLNYEVLTHLSENIKRNIL